MAHSQQTTRWPHGSKIYREGRSKQRKHGGPDDDAANLLSCFARAATESCDCFPSDLPAPPFPFCSSRAGCAFSLEPRGAGPPFAPSFLARLSFRFRFHQVRILCATVPRLPDLDSIRLRLLLRPRLGRFS